MLITTSYDYVMVIFEVVNEGLPRAGFRVMGPSMWRNGSKETAPCVASLMAMHLPLLFLLFVVLMVVAPQFAEPFADSETLDTTIA